MEFRILVEFGADDLQIEELLFKGLPSVGNQVEFHSIRIFSPINYHVGSRNLSTLILEREKKHIQFVIAEGCKVCPAGVRSLFLHQPHVCDWLLHFNSTAKLSLFLNQLESILKNEATPDVNFSQSQVSDDDRLNAESYTATGSTPELDPLLSDQVSVIPSLPMEEQIEEICEGESECAMSRKSSIYTKDRVRKYKSTDNRFRTTAFQKVGIKKPAKSFVMKNKTLYDWISRKLGNSRQCEIKAGDRCPLVIQSDIIQWIEKSTTRVNLQDIVDVAVHKSSSFIPTSKWAARLCVRFGLLDHLSCSLDELLRVAEIPEAPFIALKTLRNSNNSQLPWSLRQQIIDFALKTSVRSAAALFSLPKSSLCEWVRKRDTNAVQTSYGRKLSYSKKSDGTLHGWFLEEVSKGTVPSDKQVQEKARSIIGQEQKTFKASRKWLMAFYRRHNICIKNPKTEATEIVNQGTVQEYSISAILNELLIEFCSMPLASSSFPVSAFVDFPTVPTTSKPVDLEQSIYANDQVHSS